MGKAQFVGCMAEAKIIKHSLTQHLLQEVACEVSVTQFLSYRDYLNALYSTMGTKHGSYSYRQFAEDLGFSRSNVIWLVTTGRRKLSSKTSQRVVDELSLKGTERRYFETLVLHDNANRPDLRQSLLEDLLSIKKSSLGNEEQQENLEYYSEWYHPVIREMTMLSDFSSDPHWIAERLQMKVLPKQAEKSLKLLEELKLIKFDQKKQRHVVTDQAIRPDRDVNTLAATRHHQKMCELAAEALTRVKAANREFNTLSVCVTKEDAMEISALIYELCEKIVRIEEKAKKKSQVYQINLQLFPLTKE